MPRFVPALLAGTSFLSFAVSAAAQQSPESRIAALEARVAELESEQSEGPQLTFGSQTETSVEFYGYIKTDFIADFGAELGNTTFGLVGIDSDDDGEFFNATAQQTRLGFRTTTATPYGDLGTRIEIDFYGGEDAFGTGNEYQPRVRHAYVELGGALVGKTWTTFMPIDSYPVTLDFQGVAGIPFARQEMVRYSFGSGAFAGEVAIEQSNGDSDNPVFVAAAAYDTDALLLRLSGIVGTVNDPAGGEEDFNGMNLSATASLWQGAEIKAAYTMGEAIASYMVFLGDDLNAEGDPIESEAAYLGLSQEVSDKLILGAVYGWRHNDEAGPSDDTDELSSVHLNARYELVENTTLGVELFHGNRETFAGDEYDVDRIQTSVQFDF